jgi:hypothetical protein
MAGEITLPIAIDIELAHHAPPANGRFPDCRSDSLAVPHYVARKPDID